MLILSSTKRRNHYCFTVLEVQIISAMCYCHKSSFKKKIRKVIKTILGSFWRVSVCCLSLYISNVWKEIAVAASVVPEIKFKTCLHSWQLLISYWRWKLSIFICNELRRLVNLKALLCGLSHMNENL